VTVLRAIIKETLSRENVDTLAADIEEPARHSPGRDERTRPSGRRP
jgi:hypothetical protein